MKYETIGTWEETAMDVCARLTKNEVIIGPKFSVYSFDPKKACIIARGPALNLDPEKLYWVVTDNTNTVTVYVAHDAWNAASFWHKFETGEMKAFETTVVCPTDSELAEIDTHYSMKYYLPELDRWLHKIRKKERFRREAKAKETKKI